MNCLAFEALLDEGAPRRLPASALEHARTCTSCTRSLARATALEAALERHFTGFSDDREPRVLEGFTDRVMVRVERGEVRGVRWLTLPDSLPWWVRAAAEPSVVLASVVAALLLWRGPELVGAVRTWATTGAQALPFGALVRDSGLESALRSLWTALVPGSGPDWAVITGVALGVAPILGLVAWAMWRAGERLADAGPLPSLR